MNSFTVLIVDDHALMRSMLAERLSQEAGVRVVGIAGNGEEALLQAVEARPDVVLMDVDMPGLLCFDAARQIRERSPETKVLFLSAYPYDRFIEAALAAQAAGYLTKSESPETIVRAVRSVAAGGTAFSPEILTRIVVEPGRTRLAGDRHSRLSTLTEREHDVLRYVARGMSQKEIARAIDVSPKTVHRHTINLMNKLDIHDRVELARYAIREGLVTP